MNIDKLVDLVLSGDVIPYTFFKSDLLENIEKVSTLPIVNRFGKFEYIAIKNNKIDFVNKVYEDGYLMNTDLFINLCARLYPGKKEIALTEVYKSPFRYDNECFIRDSENNIALEVIRANMFLEKEYSEGDTLRILDKLGKYVASVMNQFWYK